DVIFLRKLVAGGSKHSFGIHVAKLAGMPTPVLHRANKMLKHLEKSHASEDIQKKLKNATDNDMQLSFFNLDDPLLEEIKEEILATNIDTLTPIEALMKLNEIKRMLVKK
ncbi:MAG: DNA mismatch repair protein MutS, partial [Methanosarcinales archaeon]|nr:DNA mismatch repair protein MutS [Methanosarcinales archaeon]